MILVVRDPSGEVFVAANITKVTSRRLGTTSTLIEIFGGENAEINYGEIDLGKSNVQMLPDPTSA